jgi:hypothetical protein
MMKVISRKLVRKAIEMINNLSKVEDSDEDDDDDDDDDEDEDKDKEDSEDKAEGGET